MTATDAVTGITGSANVTVTPAAAVGFSIIGPATVAADTPFDVAVAALDPYGNVDSNYQGTITFATTDPDPGVVLPASYTFTANDAGVIPAGGVLLVTPGDQGRYVTDTNSLMGSLTLTVTAPPPPPGGGAGAAGKSKADWPSEETSTSPVRGDVFFSWMAGRRVGTWSRERPSFETAWEAIPGDCVSRGRSDYSNRLRGSS